MIDQRQSLLFYAMGKWEGGRQIRVLEASMLLVHFYEKGLHPSF